jgi:hypothetical protein
VIRELEPYIGQDEAIDIAIRVKRGLRDPNEPGGLTKDHLYLTGTDTVSRTLAADPAAYQLLMATKWPVELISVATGLKESGELSDPNYLPDERRLGIHRRTIATY